ncbi:MAG: phosphoribosylglycinamide formyltransferase [Candidatus Marinimicrobia bacterium]|nr:phosphoribosylglycinamide formyltransferase [Candidatus Neomarinimicrobiota bacterium]
MEIYRHICNGSINGIIGVVISENPNSKAISFAKKNKIKINVINKKIIEDRDIYGDYLLNILESEKIDLVVLAGYLKMIPQSVIMNYKNKIINVHPSLLPSFGGKGFYGMKVHKAVIDSKVAFTGASVHFVDEFYDNGPVIMQEKVRVSVSDNPDSISKKVLAIEHKILPYIVKKFCLNEIIFKNNLPFVLRRNK